MFDPRFGRRPWRDTMQVCLNGHIINEGYKEYPHLNKTFCEKCGEKTIIKCPNCNHEIPGDLQDTGIVVLGTGKSDPPDYCQSCGNPFPWYKESSFSSNIQIKIDNVIENIKMIFSRFNIIVRQLRKRREDRETLDVKDEYDVQDLSHVLLKLFFDDVRAEEWTPSYAGKNSRIDFLLKGYDIIIEIKMTRKGLGEKEVSDQLIIDIERYQSHPSCKYLICFIYDPEGRIGNPKGLVNDLEGKKRENISLILLINPE